MIIRWVTIVPVRGQHTLSGVLTSLRNDAYMDVARLVRYSDRWRVRSTMYDRGLKPGFGKR